ncbi:MAG: helix-turn-helix domain-containing protein [Chitinophagales bacterium]
MISSKHLVLLSFTNNGKEFEIIAIVLRIIIIFANKLKHKMNNSLDLGKKIRRYREEKGYSQDYMANMLDITQPTYAKYENESTEITVKRLNEIAKILQLDISNFFTTEQRVINISDFKEHSTNNYIENQYTETKELYQKLIDTLEKEIDHLKAEVNYLRKITEN